ncbi:hypothetical protein [Actinomadura verrucosospora]|uniref:Uncharacterized protein n=1 Tax=Actinomadura verrucosospora TaxID=46165 RepID=A0A7D3W0H6_ACTVE|nr:hypothetical protein [Actinomadura verrucosospora]QKG23412.1 hypothetical protein ACTIVE_5055 [Actinomadura verrucosospora]
MFRKVLVLPVLLLTLVGASACGGGKKADDSSARVAAGRSPAASSPAASPSSCPTSTTKHFAKTRFAADAGLAFGAFHRYIWNPYQAGSFKQGANGRTKAFAKAAAAGLFAANRVNAARKLIGADPKLCKALKVPAEKVSAMFGSLAGKFKSGQLDPSEIGSVGSAIDGMKSNAKNQAGTNITEKAPNLGG